MRQRISTDEGPAEPEFTILNHRAGKKQSTKRESAGHTIELDPQEFQKILEIIEIILGIIEIQLLQI